MLTLPADFTDTARATFGESLWQTYIEALSQPAPVSIRLNGRKITACEIADGAGKVAWCDAGFYIKERPQFTFDPLMHAGAYYVQEGSSMFLHHIMKHIAGTEPVIMIDMCAAPGGKSTAACTLLHEDSLLVCNEPIPHRASILAENIMKWGLPNVVVTNNYPQELRQTGIAADIVLCDVPCSGEGMFRKDEGAVAEWSLQNVERCRTLQREIVGEAWQCLRQGGTMIYSTCTFNTRENEENVQWICRNFDAETVDIPIEKEWGITGSLLKDFNGSVYRFIPGATRGEGLFVAVIRKKGECGQKMKKIKATNGKEKHITEWIEHPEKYIVEEEKNVLTAIPRQWFALIKHLSATLKVIHRGIKLGTVKGRDIVPEQCLALSTALKREAFATVETDRNTATAYLRKEAVTLPDGTPHGIVLLTYGNMPLGFVKNIGNRANNLYPAEWRIKTTHIPRETNEVITKYTGKQ
ncbi:methyltransferase RsmF C-terminal domain-like protein [Prevotella sp. OH937_COT-195]|uniref:methyltransferase RsmF C-terminal domain-like protein n=1 Tax=Prevotella sp. OH937_COT-195 TaxID=2491051 RepID=UPI000F6474A8|nr:hypothetical protein [Prevotella sp. OH937_COT-195]RRC97658.1 hypothetical protein EII32_10205 [Prevotella sp. OH937_COT-195]